MLAHQFLSWLIPSQLPKGFHPAWFCREGEKSHHIKITEGFEVGRGAKSGNALRIVVNPRPARAWWLMCHMCPRTSQLLCCYHPYLLTILHACPAKGRNLPCGTEGWDVPSALMPAASSKHLLYTYTSAMRDFHEAGEHHTEEEFHSVNF